ncbi:MAG: hypothetical protein QOD84_3000 [Acidobacteriaceae bacterium]|jgi:hypothetical protein
MEISLARQVISLAGAVTILTAYIAHQLHWMDANKPLYNTLNAIGAAILCYIALRPFQAGFVVMESTWTIISLYALARGRKQA